MANRFSIEAIFKAQDKISAPISRMQNRVGKFTRSAEANMRKLASASNSVAKGIGKAAVGIGKIGAAGIAAGAAATALTFNKLAESADKLAKQSRRMQFPIEELQQWQFVAEQSGFTIEEFNKASEGMNKRVGELKAGTGSLFTLLKKTDQGFLNQVKSTKSSSEALQLMIEKMQSIKDPAEQAAFANAAFGRQGLKMSNIAELGADKIAELMAEQRKNGVITREQAEQAEAYNDAVNSLKKSITGLLQGSLLPMAPALTKNIKAMQAWINENKELLQQRILKFFTDFKGKVIELFKAFVTFSKEVDLGAKLLGFFDVISKVFTFLSQHGSTVLKTAAIIGGLVVALNSLVAVMTLVNLVMTANPLGLIIAGVAAAIAAFSALVIWIDDVIAGFEKMPAILRIILAPLEAIMRAIKFVKDGFSGGFGGAFDKLKSGIFGDNESATFEANSGQVKPQIVTPQDAIARQVTETITQSTGTIKDETGRAEVTDGKLGSGLMLMPSGAF